VADSELPFYEHEAEAIRRIKKGLERFAPLVRAFPNVEVPDSYNKFSECDLVVATPWFISIIELKHWYGIIEVGEVQWSRDERPIANPHQNNQFKCRSLASWLNRQLPALKIPFIDSVVILTHDDAEVTLYSGATDLQSERRANKTFAGIASFLQIFEDRLTELQRKKSPYSQPDFELIGNKLQELANKPKHFATQIPGFHIVETLSESPLVSEFLAYAEGVPDKKPKRLRLFGSLSTDPALRAKQTRSSAISKLPPHPNILRTSYHPNHRELLVEVTDWSQLGTLRDVLRKDAKLPCNQVSSIARQLFSAIALIHQHNLVHRDIRPENILVAGDTIQMMNFELAYDPAEEHTVFTDEDEKAELPYRAPEVLSKHTEPVSDMYSAGVLLYELLTSKPPIRAWQELSKSNGKISQIALDAIPEDCQPLKSIIERSIRVTPSERVSASEALTMLQAPLKEPDQPQMLSVWKLVDKISEGATAEVWRALKSGEETVALKLFHNDQPPEIAKHEYEMANSVKQSPYVVRVMTYFAWQDGRRCIEMEYLDGTTLRQDIDQQRRPDDLVFHKTASELLDALAELHMDHANAEEAIRSRIVHNDLNPSNLMLTRGGPKIVDFALASETGIGPLCGIPGYIAPDLVIDGELQRCPSGDLFALATCLFEWYTGSHPFGRQPAGSKPIASFEELDLSKSRKRWFERALAPSAKLRFKSATEAKEALLKEDSEEETSGAVIQYIEQELSTESAPHAIPDVQGPSAPPAAAFVDYLNTLHNSTSANKHALAESQALSEYFGTVRVAHPITDELRRIFEEDDRAIVLLTGHAGDGKSTIALDLYKHFLGRPLHQKLDSAMSDVQTVSLAKRSLTIVKDMSEATPSKRTELMAQALATDGAHLIVTNTGPLLTTCSEFFASFNLIDALDLESSILGILQRPVVKGLSVDHQMITKDGRKVWIANLSMYDNLFLVDAFLKNASQHTEFSQCGHCPAFNRCPIVFNAQTVAQNQIVSDRIYLLHRRLASYGDRVTARQLIAHLAFAITGGLSCREIVKHATLNEHSLRTTYNISNTLFGYEGLRINKAARMLQAVQLLDALEPGSEPDSVIDLLMSRSGSEFMPVSQDCMVLYRALQRGLEEAGRDSKSGLRRSLRRLLYICGQWENDKTFQSRFLQSERLLDFERWAKDGLQASERRLLRDRILTALLEHFTGYRGGQYDKLPRNVLYLTLKRGGDELPQPVQVILRTYPFDMFELKFDQSERRLVLLNRDPQQSNELTLPLPVLDYVERILQGALGDELDDIYLNRLELFKSQLLSNNSDEVEPSDLELLETSADGTVRKFSVRIKGRELQADYI